ncbi:MAG: 1-deoxy-D-xylulose-5-phosphate reductoisomerase [Muribaculaceae bacterium]|nr:1-deoxy-D-xylulose-5-phosphate reductoisomerase [Muribaculaceae bacterium]
MRETRRNIAVLGSTGSIGRQTLDIIAEYPDLFNAWLLVARSSADLLIQQARLMRPHMVIIADEQYYEYVRDALEDTDIKVATGSAAIAQAVTAPEIDTVVTAMVGYSGLESTIAAIGADKRIALANKETLVVAGELIDRLLKDSKSVLYPVDSEHGAFYQCLVGERMQDVEKLWLTASGGPFRTLPKEQLETVTAADALKHPNWSMGAKITIDSATMMNKGFEMIEARWLFGIMPDDIEIVVHPQSIIHSMVAFKDGSVKAQLGLPDMHLPIRYALGLPDRRLASDCRKMTIEDMAMLTLERPDFDKFPLLGTAYAAARKGGTAPCVMNAANEIAVASFLQDKIRFTDIYKIIEQTMAQAPHVDHPTYDDYVASNDDARARATALVNKSLAVNQHSAIN